MIQNNLKSASSNYVVRNKSPKTYNKIDHIGIVLRL